MHGEKTSESWMMTLPSTSLHGRRNSLENRRVKRDSQLDAREETYSPYRPSACGDQYGVRSTRKHKDLSPMGIGASAERFTAKLLEGRRGRASSDVSVTRNSPPASVSSPRSRNAKYGSPGALINHRYDADTESSSRRRGSSPSSPSSTSSSSDSYAVYSNSLPRTGRRPLPQGPGPLLPGSDGGFRRKFVDHGTSSMGSPKGPLRADHQVASLEAHGRFGSRSRYRYETDNFLARTSLSRARSQSLGSVKRERLHSPSTSDIQRGSSSTYVYRGQSSKTSTLIKSPSLDGLSNRHYSHEARSIEQRLERLSLYSQPSSRRSKSPVMPVDAISNGTAYVNSGSPIARQNSFRADAKSVTPPSRKKPASPTSLAKYISSSPFDEDVEPVGLQSPTQNSKAITDGLVGFSNLGNTCFMNCIVQCLRNLKCLREIFVSDGFRRDLNDSNSPNKGKIAKTFAKVVKESWSGDKIPFSVLSLSELKYEIQQYAPRFSGYDQQDSQEFLRFLLEGLHDDLNIVTKKQKRPATPDDSMLSDREKGILAWESYEVTEKSRITNLFVGQLKSTLTCSLCQYTSVAFDPFWDLSLPIPTAGSSGGQINLTDCFDGFTQEEMLDGEEQPTCEYCKVRRKSTKKFSIERFPPVLVIHLKRFSGIRYRTKLATVVRFPSSLSLSSYSSAKGQAVIYSLAGVSNHMGSTFSGHYTAFCKHPDSNMWYSYNDSRVSKIVEGDVVTASAYVMFYELNVGKSSL